MNFAPLHCIVLVFFWCVLYCTGILLRCLYCTGLFWCALYCTVFFWCSLYCTGILLMCTVRTVQVFFWCALYGTGILLMCTLLYWYSFDVHCTVLVFFLCALYCTGILLMCTLLYWYSFDVYSVVPVSFFSVGRTGLMQMQSLMRFVNINAKSRYTVPKIMIIIEHTTVW